MSDKSEAVAVTAKPRRSRWWRYVRDLLIVILVIFAVQWWQSRGMAQGVAPPLVGHMLDGAPYQLDPADGPVLVHFWATWCPVCRLEQGSIDSIAADMPVISVATTSGTADEVAAYMRAENLTMPVLFDESGDVARQWGVNGVPASFIVDSQGEISYAGMGYATEIGLRARMWLARW